jgi:hypothetical protein
MIPSLSSLAREHGIAYIEGWMIGIEVPNVKECPIVFRGEVV